MPDEKVITPATPAENPPAKRALYDKLHASQLYTKSYEDFEKQYSTPDAVGKLYDGLSKTQLYTKSRQDFDKQYFSTPTSSQPKDSSFLTDFSNLKTIVPGGIKPTAKTPPKIDYTKPLNPAQITDELFTKKVEEEKIQKAKDFQDVVSNTAKANANIVSILNQNGEQFVRNRLADLELDKRFQDRFNNFARTDNTAAPIRIPDELRKAERANLVGSFTPEQVDESLNNPITRRKVVEKQIRTLRKDGKDKEANNLSADLYISAATDANQDNATKIKSNADKIKKGEYQFVDGRLIKPQGVWEAIGTGFEERNKSYDLGHDLLVGSKENNIKLLNKRLGEVRELNDPHNALPMPVGAGGAVGHFVGAEGISTVKGVAPNLIPGVGTAAAVALSAEEMGMRSYGDKTLAVYAEQKQKLAEQHPDWSEEQVDNEAYEIANKSGKAAGWADAAVAALLTKGVGGGSKLSKAERMWSKEAIQAGKSIPKESLSALKKIGQASKEFAGNTIKTGIPVGAAAGGAQVAKNLYDISLGIDKKWDDDVAASMKGMLLLHTMFHAAGAVGKGVFKGGKAIYQAFSKMKPEDVRQIGNNLVEDKILSRYEADAIISDIEAHRLQDLKIPEHITDTDSRLKIHDKIGEHDKLRAQLKGEGGGGLHESYAGILKDKIKKVEDDIHILSQPPEEQVRLLTVKAKELERQLTEDKTARAEGKAPKLEDRELVKRDLKEVNGQLKEVTDRVNSEDYKAGKVIAPHIEQIPGMLQDMAKQEPHQFLKFIADQAQGISENGEAVTGGDTRYALKEMGIPDKLVDQAIEMFPAPKVEPKPESGISIIRPEEMPKNETITIESKEPVVEEKTDYGKLANDFYERIDFEKGNQTIKIGEYQLERVKPEGESASYYIDGEEIPYLAENMRGLTKEERVDLIKEEIENIVKNRELNKDKTEYTTSALESEVKKYLDDNGIKYTYQPSLKGDSKYFKTDKGTIRISDHTGNFRQYPDVVSYFFPDFYGKGEINNKLNEVFGKGEPTTEANKSIPIEPKSIKQLALENKSTAPKIPTNKVFLNEVGIAPKEDVSKVDKYFNEERTTELPVQEVDVSNIIPTQKNLTIDNLNKTKNVQNSNEAIVLLKKGDDYYILDGHHRIANEILKGNSKIDAHVFDANIGEKANQSIPENKGAATEPTSEKGVPESTTTTGRGGTETTTPVLEPPKIEVTEEPTTESGDASQPQEVSGESGRTVGISHERTNQLAREYGLPEYDTSPERIKEWNEEAVKRLQDPEALPKLIWKLRLGQMPDAVETTMMLEYIASLDAKIQEAPTPELLAKLTRAKDLSNVMGRLWGQTGIARQQTRNSENTLGDFLSAEAASRGYESFSQKELDGLKAEYEKGMAAKEGYEEGQAKLFEQRVKEEVDKKVKEILKLTGKAPKKTKEQYSTERKAIIQKMRADLLKVAKGGGGLQSSIPGIAQLQAIAPHVAKLVKSYIQEGITKFEDVVAKMHKDLGEVADGITENQVKELLYGEYKIKRPKVKLDEATQKLQDEYIQFLKEVAIRRDKAAYDKLSAGQKTLLGLEKVLGLKRQIQTSIDWSIPFRQGITVMANPRHWDIAGKGIYNMARATFSQKKYDRINFELKNDPLFKEMEDAGVHFTDIDTFDNTKREEDSQRSFLTQIPVLKHLFLGTNRAAATFSNVARFERYAKMKEVLNKYATEKEMSPEQRAEWNKDSAKWVNNLTGRGNMLSFLESPSGQRWMGRVLYGARLMASRFNLLNPVYYGKMPKAVRIEALKDMGAFAATMIATGLALKAGGADITLDPDDPDFLKAKWGDKRYDISGGLVNYIRLYSRLGKLATLRFNQNNDPKEDTKYGASTGKGVVSFFRYKLAPNTSYFVDALTGKDALGRDFNPYEVLKLYPMYMDDLTDAWKDEGAMSLATVLAPSLLGVGVQDYEDKKGQRKGGGGAGASGNYGAPKAPSAPKKPTRPKRPGE